MSQGVGEVYPGLQSGSATLAAGVATVTFKKQYYEAPTVLLQPTTEGTAPVQLQPSTIGTAGFSVTSQELALTSAVTGGTLATHVLSGTTSVASFKWVAFIERGK